MCQGELSRGATKFSELGAGAVLSPNSQRAMQLIDPRIFEGFQRRAAFGVDPPDENGIFPWMTMTKGQSLDIGEPVMQWNHEIRGSTIHRAHFLDELAELIEPNHAHFGKSVTKISENGDDNPIILNFKDGTTAEADLVIELVPDHGTTLGWSIWEMPPAPTYYKGRVAIMGDAAHASTSYQDAGAGQTIEDSLVMERLLGKYFDPEREKVHALDTVETTHLIFQAFGTVRRHRSQKFQTTSSETGRILTGAEPGVSMKAADMSKRMDGRQDWMWNYDQEMQVKDAMLIFEEVEWSRARNAANSSA
ncbi:monoxygenase, putative [Talaromyces stipitatus ATCC 10500]|uniref:Monoxygenase, putative n=1 Tax=Talaromyces stipitatus (strain ATCC 10500 / CBS 375.48 / QM 6759 / NRRL 1006) TaxID=441959 RepID=B8MLT8_TALSN|nr:monooxygenase, putative [Talaromyces stipitatus ATCC 10500]EED13805.1 monoxygenase, putative [Talaromyces stipitatus ATCC 10500]